MAEITVPPTWDQVRALQARILELQETVRRLRAENARQAIREMELRAIVARLRGARAVDVC